MPERYAASPNEYLWRAFKAGAPAVVDVITDPYCDVQTQEFYGY